jgi:hypothetical protein
MTLARAETTLARAEMTLPQGKMALPQGWGQAANSEDGFSDSEGIFCGAFGESGKRRNL